MSFFTFRENKCEHLSIYHEVSTRTKECRANAMKSTQRHFFRGNRNYQNNVYQKRIELLILTVDS